MKDEEYMKLALELAGRGVGRTSPNPMVGAVIVKAGRVIGQGWHRRYGGLHGEREALADCRESPRGAVLYVTLEPCCHTGKQPPCTEAILESGISRVVTGSRDPNPLVSGKGIKYLRDHGIQVDEGILKDECDGLNYVFFHYISTGRPYVVMKYAMTMDGKIATRTGQSQWITGENARRRVHEDRHRYSAIMAGVGTVLQDNPSLTCRMEHGVNPVRIICDSRLRTPVDAEVVLTARSVPTILATCCREEGRYKPYVNAGCRILPLPSTEGGVDLKELTNRLGREGIDSILLEGGGTLNWSSLESGIVSRVQAYIAPKIFGGGAAKSPVGGLGTACPDHGFRLKNSRVTALGGDFLIESEVDNHVYGNC
ncbi:MAG: bifunctional diaminohydroxyphosphoribosylaminopyrimidine deaminase/5-amino-6-(5-phosphoribosylamino)uracil reductase RibD [Clostridium sp.]|nr:bifunctional diaminohydroxyphosphoribosylaminopyrimidine deaminase/5-amino-6-(5-phosphoribosylamino)uracil reductase RibD [Clostridium sp.]